jgi:16S rRNA processing protein RimM
MPASRVCLGQIVGVHGVRGLVRVKLFAEDPASLTAYGPLSNEAGTRRFALVPQSPAKGVWVTRVEGVADRSAAEALQGTTLWVDRAALPPAEDEDTFYHADLIGLRADLADGTPLGTVRAVHDFGAGELLEIAGAGGSVMMPFTRAAVPVVDVAGGRIVVDPPAGLLDPAGPEGGEPEGGRAP